MDSRSDDERTYNERAARRELDARLESEEREAEASRATDAHRDGTCGCADRPCVQGCVGADGGHCGCSDLPSKTYAALARARAATSKAAAAMGRAGRGASKRRGGATATEISEYMRGLAAKRRNPGRKPRAHE